MWELSYECDNASNLNKYVSEEKFTNMQALAMTTSSKTAAVNTPIRDTFHLGVYSRSFLLSLSLINLALGLVFYIVPGTIIPYWSWPVKELAVRFLGAIFLAISLGCWSAIQAKLWQRAKILVLVGGAFFSLTGIISVVRGVTVSSATVIWLWTFYFLAAGAGCLILLGEYGWHRKQTEVSAKTVALKPGRIFFGIQTSVVGIFGAMMLLLPSVAQDQFWPWKVATPTLQTFGALFLATCLATGWAFLQRDPSRIIVLLPLDAIFPSLALIAVGIGWNTIVAESPSWLVTAVWLFLYSFVAAGSTLLYIVLRKDTRSHNSEQDRD